MKIILFLTLTLLAEIALARSPYYGPYLSYTLGREGTNAPWANCRVVPHKVTIKKGDGTNTVKSIDLDSEELASVIMSASRGKIEVTGHHKKRQIPEVEISAGVVPEIKNFPLFQDDSQIRTRPGKDSAALIRLARQHCGKLTAK